MSKILGQIIYLPSVYNGKRWGYPELIYVKDYLFDTIQGSRFPEEVEGGRSGSYPKSRCLPYSDEVWGMCQQHTAQRLELAQDYVRLEKLARRKSMQTQLKE